MESVRTHVHMRMCAHTHTFTQSLISKEAGYSSRGATSQGDAVPVLFSKARHP